VARASRSPLLSFYRTLRTQSHHEVDAAVDANTSMQIVLEKIARLMAEQSVFSVDSVFVERTNGGNSALSSRRFC
jgi:hypothetical protein